MANAYGFIEITGVVAAVDALDIMCKAADVQLASWERKLGGRLVTMIIEGDISSVRTAIEAGSTLAIKKPAAYGVISNPHPEIERIVALSRSRFAGKAEEPSENKMLGENPPEFHPKKTKSGNS